MYKRQVVNDARIMDSAWASDGPRCYCSPHTSVPAWRKDTSLSHSRFGVNCESSKVAISMVAPSKQALSIARGERSRSSCSIRLTRRRRRRVGEGNTRPHTSLGTISQTLSWNFGGSVEDGTICDSDHRRCTWDGRTWRRRHRLSPTHQATAHQATSGVANTLSVWMPLTV